MVLHIQAATLPPSRFDLQYLAKVHQILPAQPIP